MPEETKESRMAAIQVDIDALTKERDDVMGDPNPGPADGSKERKIAELTEAIAAKCEEREKVRG